MLTEAGCECELLAAEPERRPNLVARLRGEPTGPTLTLIWPRRHGPRRPRRLDPRPLGRRPRRRLVWGRGALDMKDQVASELAACLALARERLAAGRGELLLVRHRRRGDRGRVRRPVALRAAPRQGALRLRRQRGRRQLAIELRRPAPLHAQRRREGGLPLPAAHPRRVAGHASLPRIGDNALLKLAPLLAALCGAAAAGADPRGRGASSPRLLGEPFTGEDGMRRGARAAARRATRCSATAAGRADARRHPHPDQGRAARKKANVIPSEAEVLIDCRVPPGHGEEEVARADRRACSARATTRSSSSSRWSATARRCRRAAGGCDREPGSPRPSPAPSCCRSVMPGFSDSHWFRKAFAEAVVYGFCPHREIGLIEAVPLIHGADERSRLADVELMAGFFYELPRRVLGERSEPERRPAPEPRRGGGPVLRLGGMALRNGLLIHGPTHWAAAVRDRDGRDRGRLGPKARAGAGAGRPGAAAPRPAEAGRGDSC